MFINCCRRFLQLNVKFKVHYPKVINTNIRNLSGHNNDNLVYSPMPDLKPNDFTVPEYVFQNFGKFPDKIAVECCATGKKYTYEDLRRKSINFSGALLKKLKLRKGDVAALVLPNVPDFVVCVLGALRAGVIITTINPLYTPDEMQRQLKDSNAKVIITLGQLEPIVRATIKLLPNPGISTVITIKLMESDSVPQGAVNFQELIDDRYDDTDVNTRINLDNLAVMPYSSGTSGLPKGVELTNRSIVANVQQMEDPHIKFGNYTTENHQDIVPGIAPWFHIYGLVGILFNNLRILSKVVSVPKFSPEIYVNILDKYKPHVLYIVPPLVLFMSNSPLIQKKHLQSIQTICSGGAPLGALDEVKLQKKADKDISIVQGYGLTESCSCIFVMSPKVKKELDVTGSVGEPVPSTVVKIVPSDNLSGDALGPNTCGELLVKGPQITSCYHNRPEETKGAFVDGWFRTGDIAYYDDNKLFYITDRLKELIKVKGFQVAPAELEEVVRAFPGISEVAVIGVPHDDYGEVPRAYIVQQPNVKIDEKLLKDYVAGKVSSFKQLRGGVVILDNIPKTPSGKILKRELKLLSRK